MRTPNFFIAGAPKCGTTAMHAYLSTHPQVFLSTPKEPHYWSQDIDNAFGDREQYLALFNQAGDEHKVVGEASASYLYSEVALGLIRQFCPQAKILVLLRNPVEQVYSFHGELRYNGNENVDDFEQAWRLQDDRAAGNHVPPKCQDAKLLLYKKVASFGQQLDRMWQLFPKEQTLVLLFDDFVADPRSCYLRIEQFLEIDDDGRTEFPVLNQAKAHLLPSLGRFLCKPPKSLVAINNAAKKLLGLERTNLQQILKVKRKRPPLTENLKQQLRQAFDEDIKKLESLLDKDLSHWR